MAETRRIAAIDMGSNTTRLMVADVRLDDDGTWRHEPIVRRSAITRLAEGVDQRGMLLPEPIARVRAALVEHRRIARDHGCAFVLATATSAVRDADNGEAFLAEIEHGFGFRAILLDGMDEAATSWAGVTSDPDTAERARAGTGILFDIGGGSTEVVRTSGGDIVDRHSFQLGSVRVTERFLSDAGDGTIPAELRAATRAGIRTSILERFPMRAQVDLPIAVAGTATTVSAILLDRPSYEPDLVHGFSFSSAQLDEVVERLAAMELNERRGVRGLEPARAPVIIGGLLILQELLAAWKIDRIETSERDILDGIALRAGRMAIEAGIFEMPEPFGRAGC